VRNLGWQFLECFVVGLGGFVFLSLLTVFGKRLII